MKEIQPPTVWKDFSLGLHQDFYILYSDLESYVDEFYASINQSQKLQLQDFLMHAVSDDLPGGMLKKYFRSSGANFIPRKPKKVLMEMLNKLDEGSRND